MTSTVEAVFRIERARIIASVAHIVRDVGIAEELAQDALVIALEAWPEIGCARQSGCLADGDGQAPGHRSGATPGGLRPQVGRGGSVAGGRTGDRAGRPDDIDDDMLRLIFTACHPVLAPEARIALTLRLLGGLSTGEIARAFLSTEPTIAQRIVRAKRALAKAQVPFEIPRRSERDARLSSVLEVIYLIFNEGYSATAGDDLTRPALCEDGLRLARVLAGLMPTEPEVQGLSALLEFQASRLNARAGPDGNRCSSPTRIGRRGTGCSSIGAWTPSVEPERARTPSRRPSPVAMPGRFVTRTPTGPPSPSSIAA